MSDKLAIIVPYRDREEHLNTFVPHMHEFLDGKGIDYDIFIAEQADDRPFNYGKLCNAVVKEIDAEYNYFCFHDIDMLPMTDECDYSYVDEPTHLANDVEAHNGELPYPQYMGGVLLINREDFENSNGYSPEYYGYGFSDLDLLYRLEKSDAYLEVYYDLNKTYSKYNNDDTLPYRIEDVDLSNNPKKQTLNLVEIEKDTRFYGVINKLTQNDIEKQFTISLWFKDNGGDYPKNLFAFEGCDSGLFLSDGKYLIGQIWDTKEKHQEVSQTYYKNTWNHAVFSFDDDKISLYLNNIKVSGNLPKDFKLYDYKNHSIKISDTNSEIKLADIFCISSKINDDIVSDLYYNGKSNLDLLKNKYGIVLSNFFNFDKLYKNRVILDSGKNYNHLNIEGSNFNLSNEEIYLTDEISIPVRLDGKYKSLVHDDDENIIEKYYEYDPDIEENADIFFNEVLTDELDYKKIGLSALKYKIMDIQDRSEYKLVRIIT